MALSFFMNLYSCTAFENIRRSWAIGPRLGDFLPRLGDSESYLGDYRHTWTVSLLTWAIEHRLGDFLTQLGVYANVVKSEWPITFNKL